MVGLVAVVAGHVWGQDSAVRLALYSWHVPLFFFLSGWFWTPGRSVRSEVTGKARSLLVPYAVWLVVIGSIWVAVERPHRTGPIALLAPLLGGKYIGQPFSAFWFVTALFTCVVLRRFLDRFPESVRWAIAVSGVVGATLAPELVRAVPLGMGTAFPALAFLLVGETFHRAVSAVRRPVTLGLGLLAAGAVGLAAGARPLDVKQADLGTPIVSVVVAMAICCGLVLLARSAEPVVPLMLHRPVGALAACGIGVVLTHAFVLWTLPSSVPDGTEFLLALVLSWGGAVVLAWVPAAGWIVGAPRRRTSAVTV